MPSRAVEVCGAVFFPFFKQPIVCLLNLTFWFCWNDSPFAISSSFCCWPCLETHYPLNFSCCFCKLGKWITNCRQFWQVWQVDTEWWSASLSPRSDAEISTTWILPSEVSHASFQWVFGECSLGFLSKAGYWALPLSARRDCRAQQAAELVFVCLFKQRAVEKQTEWFNYWWVIEF